MLVVEKTVKTPDYLIIAKKAYAAACVAYLPNIEYFTWDELNENDKEYYLKTTKTVCRLCLEYPKGSTQLYNQIRTILNQNKKLANWKYGKFYSIEKRLDPAMVDTFEQMNDMDKLDFMLFYDAIHSMVSLLPKDICYE